MSTSIAKVPVTGPVQVRVSGLVGDRQADPAQHGGTDKAVYAYAVEDLEWWSGELRRPVPPASFGENLTVSGLELSTAVVGEQWQVGSAVLEVSEPRTPCWKLGMAMGDALFPRAFVAARRPGVMLRVLRDGALQAGDEVTLGRRPSHGVTVADVFAMYLGDRSMTSRVMGAPELAQHWHAWVEHRTIWHVDEERKRAAEGG
jgi:MOSC domain-containing protein YiiM